MPQRKSDIELIGVAYELKVNVKIRQSALNGCMWHFVCVT